MTKSLILAAAMALTLGAGAAMAQEGDAQNLFNGSPQVFNQFSHGALSTSTGWQVGGTGRGVYSVQTQKLVPAPDGSDGGGH